MLTLYIKVKFFLEKMLKRTKKPHSQKSSVQQNPFSLITEMLTWMLITSVCTEDLL